jgi:hypothetical protein
MHPDSLTGSTDAFLARLAGVQSSGIVYDSFELDSVAVAAASVVVRWGWVSGLRLPSLGCVEAHVSASVPCLTTTMAAPAGKELRSSCGCVLLGMAPSYVRGRGCRQPLDLLPARSCLEVTTSSWHPMALPLHLINFTRRSGRRRLDVACELCCCTAAHRWSRPAGRGLVHRQGLWWMRSTCTSAPRRASTGGRCVQALWGCQRRGA